MPNCTVATQNPGLAPIWLVPILQQLQQIQQDQAQMLHHFANQDARRRNTKVIDAGQLFTPLVSVSGVAGPGIPGVTAPNPGIAPVVGQSSPLFPVNRTALRDLTLQNIADLAAFYNETFDYDTSYPGPVSVYDLQDSFSEWIKQ
jgi:hypothetical protein